MPLLLPAGNASPWTGPTGNNTWLLEGRVPTLIDAGVGAPAHIESLSHALAGNALSQVLVTHGHVDHVSGVPALKARWTSVRVRQPGGGDTLRHDERIAAGDGTLRAVYTPGHSPDHYCFFSEESGDLYCGDLLQLGGTVVIPASRGGNLVQYLDSLKLIRGLQPARLLPGHGPIVSDPASLIAHYLEHRALRDRQVLAALAAGARTPLDVVAKVYDRLSPALLDAAAETVLAHLIKLRDEGAVREDGSGWIQAK